MKKTAVLMACLAAVACPSVFGQDAMQYGVRHLSVLAENQRIRVLRYSPHKGDKTSMHSHPSTVVYVVKGGRILYTFPDGTTKVAELKTGEALIRPPVVHADEALDDVEAVLTELKPRSLAE